MNNDELKKKIAIICARGYDEWVEEDYARRIEKIDFDKLADTLIEAGIGDVSELKKHRVVVEKSLIPEDDNVYVLPNIPPTVKQLYSGEEVEQIVKEREEYKRRAARAARALYKACKDIKDICEYLVKVGGTGVITIKNYAPEQSEPSAYIDRAEKELAEERKDD